MRVKLTKEHEDAGVVYPADTVLEVDEPTAQWLETNNVGLVLPEPKAANPPKQKKE